jgi:hypothetical protein
MTGSGPFQVDEDKALEALTFAWADEYDQIWCYDGEWGAHHKDAGEEDDVAPFPTPDDLNRALRLDWSKRNPEPGRDLRAYPRRRLLTLRGTWIPSLPQGEPRLPCEREAGAWCRRRPAVAFTLLAAQQPQGRFSATKQTRLLAGEPEPHPRIAPLPGGEPCPGVTHFGKASFANLPGHGR